MRKTHFVGRLVLTEVESEDGLNDKGYQQADVKAERIGTRELLDMTITEENRTQVIRKLRHLITLIGDVNELD